MRFGQAECGRLPGCRFLLPWSGFRGFQYSGNLKTYRNYWNDFPETPEMLLLELLEFPESCQNDAMGCHFTAEFSPGFERCLVGVELRLPESGFILHPRLPVLEICGG